MEKNILEKLKEFEIIPIKTEKGYSFVCKVCGRKIETLGNAQEQEVIFDLYLSPDNEIEFVNKEDNEIVGSNILISRDCGHTLGDWNEEVVLAMLEELEKEIV